MNSRPTFPFVRVCLSSMLLIALSACHAQQPPDPMQDSKAERAQHEYPADPKDLSEEQWRERLTPEEYRVLRQSGTERPGTGVLENHEGEGIYRCAACGAELFRSNHKFHSGCGWPAFYDGAGNQNLRLIEDRSLGMLRTEVRCARCDSHLGHLFSGEGYATPIDQRYCINSVCLDFEPAPSDSSANDAPAAETPTQPAIDQAPEAKTSPNAEN